MLEEGNMHSEGRGPVSRRAFLLTVAAAAIAVAVAGGVFAARKKAPGPAQVRMSKEMGMSHPHSGHLYMQTNETRNAIVHYRWSANGALTEAERVVTGGAGGGAVGPTSHSYPSREI